MNWKVRFTNPYFIFGIIGLFFTATQLDPTTLTTWVTLGSSILHFLSNPFQIGCFVVALVGIIVNPTTKGLTDDTKVTPPTDTQA